MVYDDKEFEKTFTKMEAYFTAYQTVGEIEDYEDDSALDSALGKLAILFTDSFSILFLKNIRDMYMKSKESKKL